MSEVKRLGVLEDHVEEAVLASLSRSGKRAQETDPDRRVGRVVGAGIA